MAKASDRITQVTYTLASPTTRGLVGTGTQSFAGDKTFQGALTGANGLTLTGGNAALGAGNLTTTGSVTAQDVFATDASGNTVVRAIESGNGDGLLDVYDSNHSTINARISGDVAADSYILATKFGIGTASPGGKLEISQAQTTSQTTTWTNPHLRIDTNATTDNGGTTAITMATSPADNYGVSIAAVRAETDGVPSFAIRQHAGTAAGVSVITFDRNRHVTIPSGKLLLTNSTTRQLDRNFTIGGATGWVWDTYRVNNTEFWWMNSDAPDGTPTSATLGYQYQGGGIGLFKFNATNVTMSHSLGIGTASPDGPLHVMAASAGSVTANSLANTLVVEGTNAGISILTPAANEGTIAFGDPDDNDIGRIKYVHASTNELQCINTSGGVRLTTTATSWAAISDERYKTNWEYFTDAVEKIKTLDCGTFEFIAEDMPGRRSGIKAQQVMKVLPEVVNHSKDADEYIVEYDGLIPLCLAAIKELAAKVEAQALEIAALKGNN